MRTKEKNNMVRKFIKKTIANIANKKTGKEVNIVKYDEEIFNLVFGMNGKKCTYEEAANIINKKYGLTGKNAIDKDVTRRRTDAIFKEMKQNTKDIEIMKSLYNNSMNSSNGGDKNNYVSDEDELD